MNEKQIFRADLHTHTTCSDGTLSPEALVVHAKKMGLSGLSITDHDTVAAYPQAIEKAKAVGLCLGTGVEFSSVFKAMNVHILGYDIDLDHAELQQFCEKHRIRREKRNKAILDKLAKAGFVLDVEAFFARGSLLGRPHIAQAMIEKGYVEDIPRAFQKYIGDKAPYYVQGDPFSVEETLEVIHASGGKAFLAHPHLIDHRQKIRSLLDLPFDGIECYYARLPLKMEERWLKMAKERQLLISGGSDFHGEFKEHLPLGCSWVDAATFKAIFQKPVA